jgi:hypothetical protein
MAWPVATQSAQQVSAARKAAAEVRQKLNSVSAGAGAHPGAGSDSDSNSDASNRGRRRDRPPDQDAFRSVFVSVDA